MNRRDAALDFLKRNGPSLPSALAHYLGSSIIIASAVLSELAAHKLVKISKLKIGGSPVYYLSGQEPQLESIFYSRLNDKDKKTYDLLKSKRILKEDELDPLTRVSLRNLGDFAVPISVNISGEKLLFWKWFLVDEAELKSLLDSYFDKKKNTVNNNPSNIENRDKESNVENIKRDKEIKREAQSNKEKENEKANNKEVKKEKKEGGLEEFIDKNKSNKPFDISNVDSDFFKSAVDFLKSSNCQIISYSKLSKREMEFVVDFSSPFGSMRLYCYAWDKKKFNDSDISKVFLNAYLKKLPAVLLTKGELTKKAKNLNLNVVVAHI